MKITMPNLIALARGKKKSEVGFAGGYIQPHLIATIVEDTVVNLEFESNEFGQENPPLPEGQYRFSLGSTNWKWLISESDRLGIPVAVLFSLENPSRYSDRLHPTLTLRVGEAVDKVYSYDKVVSHG